MNRYSKIFLTTALMSLVTLGCNEDFLDRPPQDAYVVDQWYQSDEELELAVNPLYGGVWFDYQRSWLNIGDVMSGNWHKGEEDPFYTLSVNQATSGVKDAYASLWMAVAYSNSVIENIKAKSGGKVTESGKNTYLGEAMVWKAMAYFYLVRAWGPVPIIESNSELITSGKANTIFRNRTQDVYEYIIRMLEKAATMLPVQNRAGRINRYSAYGLLAKVYLTRSGFGGTSKNQADLDKAKEYAGIVVNDSGIKLELEYPNLFNINQNKGNRNPENLISWHWIGGPGWGTQNALQADLAVQRLTGFGDGWGTWSGPSIDLQALFDESAERVGAENRVDNVRRKYTMMMDGDFYPELDRAATSFKEEKDPYYTGGGVRVRWDGGGVFASPTGAFARKHIVGTKEDNDAEGGGFITFMKTNLSTHILRVADIYLVYAEAILGNAASTTDAEALAAFNAVRVRGGAPQVTSITFRDILDERRRELAFEGDNWFDYVRLWYYNPSEAIALLSAQERGSFQGNATTPARTINSRKYVPSNGDFQLPIPEVDLLKNPNLQKEPVAFDFSELDF